MADRVARLDLVLDRRPLDAEGVVDVPIVVEAVQDAPRDGGQSVDIDVPLAPVLEGPPALVPVSPRFVSGV
jgi:hypothetical protein